MTPPAPAAEGDILELRFDAVAPRGDAVANHGADKPVFAARVVPGELARVRVRRVRRTWIAVDVLEILEPSPHRTHPGCPLFETCAGCQLQHIDYDHQLAVKHRMVEVALQELATLRAPPLRPVIAAPNPWNYRNHARFTVKNGELGFVRRFRRQWFAVPTCPIMEPRINDVLARLQGRLHGRSQCNLRVGEPGDDTVMVQPALGPELGLPSGQPHVWQRVDGRRFRVSAASFFQVNSAQAKTLMRVVNTAVAPHPDATVVDAYAGVGTFAATMAPRCRAVVAIEESGPAVRDAELNLAEFPNVEIRLGKTEEILGTLSAPVHAIILDPPRSGCHGGTLEAVANLGPERIVYVSCDPPTLGRDLATLTTDGAYTLASIQPIDMFPHTHHVECVATLVRTARPPR